MAGMMPVWKTCFYILEGPKVLSLVSGGHTSQPTSNPVHLTNFIREPNQQGFQRSRAMGGETHFFHPSTDTKQEIAVMYESTCPVVMADANL